MLKLIGALLVVWLVLAVLGSLIQGLFWLTVVAVVLFLATGAWGAVQRGKTTAR